MNVVWNANAAEYAQAHFVERFDMSGGSTFTRYVKPDRVLRQEIYRTGTVLGAERQAWLKIGDQTWHEVNDSNGTRAPWTLTTDTDLMQSAFSSTLLNIAVGDGSGWSRESTRDGGCLFQKQSTDLRYGGPAVDSIEFDRSGRPTEAFLGGNAWHITLDYVTLVTIEPPE